MLDAIVRARRFVVISGSRSLAVKWSHPTRLETRTKESNMCASCGVTKPCGAMKVSLETRSSALASLHRRPTCPDFRKV